MDFSKLMEQAMKMQDKLNENKEALSKKEFTIEANGAIKLVFTGDYKLKELTIDKDVLSDKEMLEEMLKNAINQGLEKVKKANDDSNNNLASNVDISSLLK